MADDSQEILGKWTVKIKDWVWEYEFLPGGDVSWRDTRSQEKGVGRWAMAPKLINISWKGSGTVESLHRPIVAEDQTGWYKADYYTGNYNMKKIVAAPPVVASDVDPSVAKLPFERYVDSFTDVQYDMNYKVPPDKSFAYSPFLQLRYSDGTTLELDIDKDFSNTSLSSDAIRDAIAHAKLGRGERIFPTVLNERTVPRLWTARAQALADQDVDANLFMGIAIAGTAFVLSIPAMPVGMGGAVAAAPKGMKRSVPGVRVPPAAIQNNAVRVGPGNLPGSLWASIQRTAAGIIYRVDMIFLQGKGAGVATARATHREMIRRAALAAQSAGEKTFQMVGKQANPNFVRHADQLAKEIGVAGSGTKGMSGAGFPDYTVTLDVAKTLAQ